MGKQKSLEIAFCATTQPKLPISHFPFCFGFDNLRAVAYRLEVEESRNRMKNQLESVQRDYEETMAERSTVLEENTRMSEERDHLRQTVHALSRTLNELKRLKDERDIAVREAKVADAECRDALLRLKQVEYENEPLVDLWDTHTVEVALPCPKLNLGIVLSGGKTDSRSSISTPIYVKDIISGSPLENMLKRLDHILMVNDIDVMEMDQRSVIDILRNSHHLKILVRRRGNVSNIRDITFTSNRDIGIELRNGVFVNAVEAGGAASRLGVEPGHRIIHVNNVPVYDAKQAEQLIECLLIASLQRFASLDVSRLLPAALAAPLWRIISRVLEDKRLLVVTELSALFALSWRMQME
ncbi:PDZ/DHR/GLGF domain protein [Dictyocaulus viviparus]|uniref:PDZ/DHR/GLGF domain protein n=1 Tax=Dictyocaulus viviparus TaxID=29172 RepID=A0A0D8XFX6_DICVI|nr:PDZ/DHR/GLGF domain protein [Dictyocaulus viviparus]